MAKKINLSFADGTTDVVYSVKNSRFFSYEKDRDELHQIYGGKAYYTSCSGYSGAGYLLVPESDNDLIQWGTYLVGGGPKYKKIVGDYEPSDFHIYGFPRPVFGYAPVSFHRGLMADPYPYVLTDGDTVAFLRDYQVPEVLRDWQKIKDSARKMSFMYILPDSDMNISGEYECRWGLYNPYHLSKVNALQFVDLTYVRDRTEESWRQLPHPNNYPQTHFKLKVSYLQEHIGGYLETIMVSRNPLGFIERVVGTQNLRATEGELGVDKWVGDGNGVIWRREGLSIHAFLELSWAEFEEENSDMAYEGHPSWVEFEKVFNVMDWFNMTKEKRRSLLEEGIYAKIETYKELPSDTVVIPRVWEITRKIE